MGEVGPQGGQGPGWGRWALRETRDLGWGRWALGEARGLGGGGGPSGRPGAWVGEVGPRGGQGPGQMGAAVQSGSTCAGP